MEKTRRKKNNEKPPHNYTVSTAVLSHLNHINHEGGRRKKPAVVADKIRCAAMACTHGTTSEELAKSTGASVITARRVLAALKHEGLMNMKVCPGRVVIWTPKPADQDSPGTA